MPSKSEKQARLMRAVAHGWKPDRVDGPTKKVAREFVRADRRKKKKKKKKKRGKAGGGRVKGTSPPEFSSEELAKLRDLLRRSRRRP